MSRTLLRLLDVKKMKFTRSPYQALDQDEGLPLGTPSKTKNPHRFPQVYHLRDIVIAVIASAILTAGLLWLGEYAYAGIMRSPTFTPDLPRNTPTIFDMDDRFVQGENGKTWGKTWYDRLMPADGGWVAVPNPSKYGLAGGYPLANRTVPTESYTMSIFHQIHCLMSMREDTHKLLEQTAQHPANVDMVHNNHCYEYIRQAILCAGDTTLEKVLEVDGERGHAVNGWGVTHMCRDFETVKRFADEHGDGVKPGDTEL